MNLVVDASAACEFLLRTDPGVRVAEAIRDHDLYAPELLDVEVLHFLRKKVLQRVLDPERARQAIDDLVSWNVERQPHRPYLPAAFGYRDRLTGYDAMYVAVAVGLDAAIVTADGPLARAGITGMKIFTT